MALVNILAIGWACGAEAWSSGDAAGLLILPLLLYFLRPLF